MRILGIIPARFAATRLPGKPLAMIGNKPLIQWVYDRTKSATKLHQIVVATDDKRIALVVKNFGGQVVMTDPEHTSGTARCQEVAANMPDYDAVVNVQGDEPFIDPEQIDQLCGLLQDGIAIATLVRPFESHVNVNDPNTVKVVLGNHHQALYFSRAAIPYDRSGVGVQRYQHVGIYGFQAQTLHEIVTLPAHPAEVAESLEQLRWLGNGYPIGVAITDKQAFGVDTAEDLAEANRIMGRFM